VGRIRGQGFRDGEVSSLGGFLMHPSRSGGAAEKK
jgi:hypothetical protein